MFIVFKSILAPSTSNSIVSLPTIQNQATTTSKVIEEDIDILLNKVDGTIQRNRDNKLYFCFFVNFCKVLF